MYPGSSVQGMTEAISLHCMARDGEIIQDVDKMIHYPYICKYFKFPVGHPNIQVEDACKDKEASLCMDGLTKYFIVLPGRFCPPVLCFRANNMLILCLC